MPAAESEPQLAFTRLFVANQPALHGFLVALVHDLHAADDLLQEIAGRMWHKFDTYDPARPFIAWGIGFARLAALEWRRKQQRLALPLDAATLEHLADDASTRVGSDDDRRAVLRDCLARLGDHPRHILHERYHDGRSVADIARGRQRSETAVYKVIKHACARLLDCMNQALCPP